MKVTQEELLKIENEIRTVAREFETERMPSRQELEDFYGNTSLTNRIARTGGIYFWADKLGLEKKECETKVGVFAENHVADMLTKMGYTVETTSFRHPYDLLVNGCVKVDVKAARISMIKTSKIRAYRIAKRQQTCDVYVFCEIEDTPTGYNISKRYVVPASVLSGQVQVEMGTLQTKYDDYCDRFDIIKKMVRFYESLGA